MFLWYKREPRFTRPNSRLVFDIRQDNVPGARGGRCGPGTASRLINILKEERMLETIAAILIILWLLGLVGGYAMGGFIHILLVIALIVVVHRVIQGRRVV